MFRSLQEDTPQVNLSERPRTQSQLRASQESLEVTQGCIDAYNRRDLDALRAFSDPGVELDWSASRWLDAGIYRGVDAVLRFYADYFDVFEKLVLEPDCLISVGESVLIPNIARVRGRDGIEVVARSTLTITVHSLKVTRIRLDQKRLTCHPESQLSTRTAYPTGLG